MTDLLSFWSGAAVLALSDGDLQAKFDGGAHHTLCVGNDLIKPSKEVKNLGVWLDPSLTMNTHINKTCSIAFYHLYNLRRI